MNDMRTWITFGRKQAELRSRFGIKFGAFDGSTIEPHIAANALSLAENPDTHPNILSTLCWHRDLSVRMAVAENPNTQWSTLVLLTFDESPDLRYLIAENHNMPLGILTILEEDENPYVRCRATKTVERIKESISSAMVA